MTVGKMVETVFGHKIDPNEVSEKFLWVFAKDSKKALEIRDTSEGDRE